MTAAVLYFANPCGDAVVDRIADGTLGMIATPRQRNTGAAAQVHAAGAAWCADNGAFSDRFDADTW